ncbi:MAG: T9SS type A sorting domain-containing protein [Candidatus Cloacimonetes bacterium]|nr:T9SS type A sorting domain-containing protein [Candidatus Cloacimonadota bacterium]
MTKCYLLPLVLLLLSFNIWADGVQPMGAGTTADPYQIASLDNLLWMSTTPDCWSSHFIQTNDIDASDTINWNNGGGFHPIGNEFTYLNDPMDEIDFCGSYNGMNHTISSLNIIQTNTYFQICTGLFSGVNGSTIENLNLYNINITGNRYTGSIAGVCINTTIRNCNISGSISSDPSIASGGLVGRSEQSYFHHCNADITINGDYMTGGIVGSNYHSRIQDCNVTGSVLGDYYTGGFAGENVFSSVINRCSNSAVVGGNEFVGGIAGTNSDSMVSYSHNTADLVGFWVLGGIVGINMYHSTITNCSNTGYQSLDDYSYGMVGGISGLNTTATVSLSNNSGNIRGCRAGGIVGEQEAQAVVVNCFNTGNISGGESSGGITSYACYEATVRNCYNTGNIYGWSTHAGGIVGEVIASPTIDNCFYDKRTALINDTNKPTIGALEPDMYREWINNGLSLDIENYMERHGDAYIISSVEDLKTMNAFSQSNYSFILTTNLDLYDDQGFFVPYFSGSFNGNGHTISNLSISSWNNQFAGLFGIISNSTICNLSIINSHVHGYYGIGGLAGLAESSIITNCFTSGNVSGSYYSAGFVGINNSDISNCYSACSVNGIYGKGFCRSYYPVSVNNCFWDIEASGQTTSDGGIGLTTAEMRTLSTYLDAGWDFVDETDNGTDDIWDMNFMINNGYPFLISLSGVNIEEMNNPDLLNLSTLIGNYPNPFNPETTINFSISKNSNVDLSIYNIKGQRVRILTNQQYPSGEHSIVWDGSDDSGKNVGSGVYFYRLSINNLTVSTMKCILMK